MSTDFRHFSGHVRTSCEYSKACSTLSCASSRCLCCEASDFHNSSEGSPMSSSHTHREITCSSPARSIDCFALLSLGTCSDLHELPLLSSFLYTSWLNSRLQVSVKFGSWVKRPWKSISFVGLKSSLWIIYKNSMRNLKIGHRLRLPVIPPEQPILADDAPGDMAGSREEEGNRLWKNSSLAFSRGRSSSCILCSCQGLSEFVQRSVKEFEWKPLGGASSLFVGL